MKEEMDIAWQPREEVDEEKETHWKGGTRGRLQKWGKMQGGSEVRVGRQWGGQKGGDEGKGSQVVGENEWAEGGRAGGDR